MSGAALPSAAGLSGATRRNLWLGALGLAMVAVIAAQDSLHVPGELGIGSDDLVAVFVMLGFGASLLYFAALRLVLWRSTTRATVWVILAGAVLLRVIPVAGPSFLSSDLYRYVWDGRVQVAGINPYRYIPADPALAALRDETVYPRINRADYAPTIYPPVAQAFFAAVAAVAPSTRAMKLAMGCVDLLSMLVMARILTMAALPPAQVAIYAWNPVFVWEYAGNAHVDALAILGIALALLAYSKRRLGSAAAALAAATLAKFLPIVLFPAIWRERRMRMVAVAASVAVVAYACYASVGLRVFGFLSGYADEEGLGSGGGLFIVRLLRAAIELPPWAGTVWIAGVAALLTGLAVRMIWFAPFSASEFARIRTAGFDAMVLATVTTVGLTPHYAWYFGWLAFLSCLAPTRSVIWLTVACLLLYLDPIHTHLLGSSVIYGPFLLLAILDWRRPLRPRAAAI